MIPSIKGATRGAMYGIMETRFSTSGPGQPLRLSDVFEDILGYMVCCAFHQEVAFLFLQKKNHAAFEQI